MCESYIIYSMIYLYIHDFKYIITLGIMIHKLLIHVLVNYFKDLKGYKYIYIYIYKN